MNAAPLHQVRRFAFLLLLGVCGCAMVKPVSGDTHVYILSQVESANFGTKRPATCVVRLESVDVASYLRTKDIGVRTGTNEIIFSNSHQWAEPLNEGIRRVLAENLRRSLAIEQVLTDQMSAPGLPVYSFHVDILACEGSPPSAEFEAVWQVTGPNGAFAHGDFRMKSATWNGTDYAALAKRLSEGIEGLAEKLLEALPGPV
jgi:uncharacterized lipoprotein YmbA